MDSRSRIFVGAAVCAALSGAIALAADAVPSKADKYSLAVPGGLTFAEFRGYEKWEVVNVSQADRMAVILGNPAMIEAYKSGVPANGKPFPDGAKMAKVHWNAKDNAFFPGPKVGGTQHDVDFMVKDSKRFADSGGWGYAYFPYDVATGTFRPATTNDHPPQANGAKCGFACHTVVKTRDYVFTEYASR